MYSNCAWWKTRVIHRIFSIYYKIDKKAQRTALLLCLRIHYLILYIW